MPIESSIAVIGALILLVADAWGLSLIPLVGNLAKVYSLSASQTAWVLSVSFLVAAGLVPTIARLGDRLGMRPLVLASLVVGLAANLMCAVAPGFVVLLIGRALLGVSVAVPLIYALIRVRGSSAKGVTRGIAILTASAGVGVAIAYVLSGVVIEAHGNVRTLFWILTGMSVFSLVVAWFYLPDSRHRQTESIDWGGAFLVCIGLVGVALALTQGNTWGWSSGRTMASLFGGLAILAVFAFYETRQENPLINVKRISNRSAAPAFFIIGVMGASATYTNLAQSTYAQLPTATGYGLGLSVLQASFSLVAIAFGLLVGGIASHPIVHRFGPRPVLIVALGILTASFVWIAFNHSTIWYFVIWDLIYGTCWAIAYTAAITSYLHDAAPPEAAMYSSANTAITYGLGGLGPALFTAVLTSKFILHTPIPAPSVFKTMYIYAAIAFGVITVVALSVRNPTFAKELTPSGAAMTPGEAPSASGQVAAGPEPA
jgi:MFS family permease